MSVDPLYVLVSVEECTRTRTPAVPLSVMVWPDPPIGKVGLSWRFTVYVGTGPSNCRTKRSKSGSSAMRTAVTFATPILPPPESTHANAGRLMLGGVGGVTGGAEIRGAEAIVAGEGEAVVSAAGVLGGPIWTHPPTSRHRPAARVSRTGE